jgi:hypothetical protein
VPSCHVTVYVPNCPRTDDDLDCLDGAPTGWILAGRGEYGSGFRLELRGEASDDPAAEEAALEATVAWLAENGMINVRPRAQVRKPLRKLRSEPPHRPDQG